MIHVVTGPPSSGKTTYIAEHKTPSDVVVDLDALAHALGYPTPHLEWGTRGDHPARDAAHTARFAVINAALTGKLRGRVLSDVWIIDSKPTPRATATYLRAGATFHDLDPGLDVCIARATAAQRAPEVLDHIRSWYAGVAPAG